MTEIRMGNYEINQPTKIMNGFIKSNPYQFNISH